MMNSSINFRLIDIGTSAGGLNALSDLLLIIPDDTNPAFFIVMHLYKKTFGDYLSFRLQKNTSFHCKLVENGEALKTKTVYIALADRNLLVRNDTIILEVGSGKPGGDHRFMLVSLYCSWYGRVEELFTSIGSKT